MLFDDQTGQMTSNASRLTGSIRVYIKCKPWNLLLPLKGVKQTHAGVVALMDQQRPAGAHRLLVVGQTYRLEVDHEDENFTPTDYQAELVEKRPTSSGYELGFRFPDATVPEEPIFQTQR